MAAKPKALMICPFCDEDQARTWQGMLRHVQAKHHDEYEAFKINKAIFLEKFACDEAGNPLVVDHTEPPASPTPPAPEPPAKKTPEDAPKETPPKGKGDPEPDGGLFHRISTSIFGRF